MVQKRCRRAGNSAMKYSIVLLLSALTVPAIAASTDWPSALNRIASGDAYWIEQAPTLSATAEIKQAQQLEDALAAALTTNTDATLKALRTIDAGKWPHMVGSDIVCTPPLEKSPKKSRRSISVPARRCWRRFKALNASGSGGNHGRVENRESPSG